MRLGIKQFAAIAGLTALEVFRQPITLLITASGVVFVGLLPVLLTHTLGEGQRLVRDSALAFHFVTGLVLGCFTACAALGQDIRKGTASAILSKPVGRALFFAAKYAGLALALTAFSAAMAVATLLSTRTAAVDFQPDWWGIGPLIVAVTLAFAVAAAHHYFARGPFASLASAYLAIAIAAALAVSCLVGGPGGGGAFGSAVPWPVLRASVLIALAILVLAGLALALATRLDAVPVLTVCSVALLLGLIADYLAGQLAGGHPALRGALDLLPNWQHFWAVDALSRDGIPWRYVGEAAAYAALYLAGVLSAGIFAFTRMEVK